MAMSSFCSNSQGCVDVWMNEETGLVCVQDAKMGKLSAVLTFTEDEWLAFTQGAHNHEFEYRNLEKR